MTNGRDFRDEKRRARRDGGNEGAFGERGAAFGFVRSCVGAAVFPHGIFFGSAIHPLTLLVSVPLPCFSAIVSLRPSSPQRRRQSAVSMVRGAGRPTSNWPLFLLAFVALTCLVLPSFAMKAIEKDNLHSLEEPKPEIVHYESRKGANADGLVSRGSGEDDFSSTVQRESFENACEAENQHMLAASPPWNASSTRYETSTLPRCMEAWSREFLPSGTSSYPPLTCIARPEWIKTCSDAGGLSVTVTALADFANTQGEVSTRAIKFPTCVSSGKACTTASTSADYLWAARLEQIGAWCQNHVNPSLQCTNVRVSTNFWDVVTWPRIVKVLLGVLITLPSLAIITTIIFCYRHYRKREHDEAQERVELLRKARFSARISQTPAKGPSPRTSIARTTQPHHTKDPLLPSMRPGETRPLIATTLARTSASPDDAPML